jgi:hypothetical protein
MNIKDLEKLKDQIEQPVVDLSAKETTVEDFVAGRVKEMQDFRKSLKIEEEWKEADVEFEPSDLDSREKRTHFEADQETGLRSRLVPISDTDEDWRSRNSDPILASKIQTALSIIIDQNPEAKLTAYGKKFEYRTALAYAMWKRNWGISGAKEIYKLFILNLAKYGWAIGRTYPRIIKYEKDIYTEKGETPDGNKYNRVTNTWFNDVAKENLNVFRTWIDEQTKPYDDYSSNDCYYEKDYSYDAAQAEFGHYDNFDKYILPGASLKMDYEKESKAEKDDDLKIRKDIVTIGFYENRLKDLYVIRIPKLKAVLHYCPLPNDDGMLSTWHTPWMLKSSDTPYGISIWKMIKQNKELYDKMQNMTMDQIVLSIYKAFFYTGTSSLVGDGKIKIKPGVGYQIVNGKIDWNEVPGPGKDAFAGLEYLKSKMDDDSAIVPILEGDATQGKTLGQSLHAKEAALKKMKLPVDNIADAIEQDAYITLSWMSQVYSTPEVMDFAELQDIQNYDMENGTTHDKIYGNMNPETNQPQGPFKATYYPQMALGVESQGGKLIESKKDRFFQVGEDFSTDDMKWRGIFKVIPKSIVAPSAELEKQRKMELFNIIVPLLPQPAQVFGKAVQQLIRIQEEDPLDWLPDEWIAFLEQDKNALFIKANPNAMPPPVPGQPQIAPPAGGMPTNQTSVQGAAGTTPGAESAPTVVPQSQIHTPTLPAVNAAPRVDFQVNRQA